MLRKDYEKTREILDDEIKHILVQFSELKMELAGMEKAYS